ncbi:6-dehydratase,dTDP-D-glucose 4 [Trichinella spiralis]
MNYHIFQNTKFETFDKSFVTLDNAVYRKSKNLILENSSNYKEWDYFVEENQIEQMDNLLLYNGDFVLAEEKKNNGIILKLFYKWNDHIYSMVFNRECKYFLPRHHNGPEEWVDNLDKLLKSLCMCNFRFNGVQLIHPVNVKKRLNMHMTPPVKHNDDDSVEIRKPDVPLFDLPYYFGEIRKEYAEQRLKMFSDFLLYTDLQTKKLMVGVVGELRQKEQICHLEIYPNEKHHFCLVNDDQYLQCSTVESLISHYFHNYKQLQGNGIDFDFIYLLVPKYRDNYDLHIRASNINLSNDRCYFGTDFPIESVRKKLKNNGDYLLQTKNSADLITVRWEGKIFDIKPQKDTIGYILPKNKNDQPTERVKSLNEFAKSAVYCKFVFHNIMLYKAVMLK